MTLEQGLAKLLIVIYMISFCYGVVLIIEGAWKMKSGNPTEGQEGIIAAMVLSIGPLLVETLFLVFGLPGAFSIF